MPHSDPERRKAYAAAYRAKHRAELAARERERISDPDIHAAKLAREAERYRANSVAILARNRQYRQAHPEQIRAQKRVYYLAHHEAELARSARYRRAHPEERRAWSRAGNHRWRMRRKAAALLAYGGTTPACHACGSTERPGLWTRDPALARRLPNERACQWYLRLERAGWPPGPLVVCRACRPRRRMAR